MRIIRAKARNVKGFADFDQTFGNVNVISGRNAEGKSTVLDILCAAFITDGERELLKVGADSGELMVVLEDGGETIEVRRTISKTGVVSQPQVKSSENGPMGAAATFLKAIVDTVTLDPIRRVMKATPKEKIKILLETMPLEMPAEPVQAAIGTFASLIPQVRLNGVANLDHIRAAHNALYEIRTGVNRDQKKAATGAAQLRETVKGWEAPEGRSWTDVFNDLDQQLQDLVAADAEKRRLADKDHAESIANVERDCGEDRRAIDADIDARIAALEQERAASKERVAATQRELVTSIDGRHLRTVDAISSGSQDERNRLTTEKAKAQQLAQGEAQVARTLELASQSAQEAEELKTRSERLTASIEALRDCEKKLLESLPIKGLVVSNGMATFNDIPLGELNTAEEAKFWIRVAVLRAQVRKLSSVVLDDCEHFDDRNWPKLLEACKGSGLQFFLSRVEPHDFTIEVI